MSLLGQLVYTSLPKVGYRLFTSTEVPPEIQQAFIQQLVYQHWNSYKPPKAGYRAAYVYQVTLEHTLFGWLYNDRMDDLGRAHVPYFVCYYYLGELHAVQLTNIFTCLQTGPIERIEQLISAFDPIDATLCSYQPVRQGVEIPLNIREQSYAALQQQKLLKFFIPSKQEILVTLDAQREQQAILRDQNIQISTAIHSQDIDVVVATELVPMKRSPSPLTMQPYSVELEEPVLTTTAIKSELAASVSRNYPQRLKAVAIIVVVGISFVLFKSWQSLTPPLTLSTEGIGSNTSTPRQSLNQQNRENTSVGVPLSRSVPGFPTGTQESIIKAALGEPTRTTKDYLPKIDAAFYDVQFNRITLGYLFDRYSRRIRQTEVSFAQSIDLPIMLATLNGMLGGQANAEIQQGLQQVYQRQSNQYPLVIGSVQGVIKRNSSDRVYIGLWETGLY